MVAEEGKLNSTAFQAPRYESLHIAAAILLAKDHHQRLLGHHGLAEAGFAAVQKSREVLVALRRQLLGGFGHPVQLDGLVIGDVEPGAVQPHIGAQNPRQQRMLLRWIAADQQNRRRCGDIAQAGRLVLIAGQGAGKGRVVRAAPVVDVVGPQHFPRKFLQQVVLFVRGAIGADDADS